ncbi:MAG: hypothetical protein ACRDUB_08490 [Mycobacterium sp.]
MPGRRYREAWTIAKSGTRSRHIGRLPTTTTSTPNTGSTATTQPNAKRFTLRRILGSGDLWISELVLTYDGEPSYVVSIMEFDAGSVIRETQYFGDPFEPGPSRAQFVD